MVNYTVPEALCSGNMAGISPEAESIPTLPRRNRGLACSGNRRQNRAPFLSPMLVIRRPANLCVCAPSLFQLLASFFTQWHTQTRNGRLTIISKIVLFTIVKKLIGNVLIFVDAW